MSGGGAGLMSCVREGSLEPPYRPPQHTSNGEGRTGRFLRGLRRMFRRRSAARAPHAPHAEPDPKSSSTSELLDAERHARRKEGAYGSGLSVSHDSVFTGERSGDESGDERPGTLGIAQVAASHRAELVAAVRRRGRGECSDDEEDLGLPRSPPASPPTDKADKRHHAGISQSSCSDGSLLSVGSSEMDEDSSSGNHHSQDHSSRSDHSDLYNVSEPPPGVAPLSHSAARHKMAVRPRRTHGAPRRKKTNPLGATALPITPELNEEMIRSTTPEVALHAGVVTESFSSSTTRQMIVKEQHQQLNRELQRVVEPSDAKLKSSSLPPGLALGQGVSSPAKLSIADSNTPRSSIKRSKSSTQEQPLRESPKPYGDSPIHKYTEDRSKYRLDKKYAEETCHDKKSKSEKKIENEVIKCKKEESFFSRLLLRKSGKKSKKDQTDGEGQEVKKSKTEKSRPTTSELEFHPEPQVYKPIPMERSYKSAGQKAFANQQHKRMDKQGGYAQDGYKDAYSAAKVSGIEYITDLKIAEETDTMLNLEMKSRFSRREDFTEKERKRSTSREAIDDKRESFNLNLDKTKRPASVQRLMDPFSSKAFITNEINQSQEEALSPSLEISDEEPPLRAMRIKTNPEYTFHSGSMPKNLPYFNPSIVVSQPQTKISQSSENVKKTTRSSENVEYREKIEREIQFPTKSEESYVTSGIRSLGDEYETRSSIGKSHSFRYASESTSISSQENQMPSLPAIVGISEPLLESWEVNYRRNVDRHDYSKRVSARNYNIVQSNSETNYDSLQSTDSSYLDSLKAEDDRKLFTNSIHITLDSHKRDSDISQIEAKIDDIISSPKPLIAPTILKSNSLDSVKSSPEKVDDRRKTISIESALSQTEKITQIETKYDSENFISVTHVNRESTPVAVKNLETKINKSDEKLQKPTKPGVPEFLNIQLNKVDAKPITNVVLTANLTPKKEIPQQDKEQDIETFPITETKVLNTLEKEPIKVEIENTQVVDKIGKTIQTQSGSPSTPRNFFKRKAVSVDHQDKPEKTRTNSLSTEGSIEKIYDNISIDQKSHSSFGSKSSIQSFDSNENKIDRQEETVVYRKKPIIGKETRDRRNDDEPELMKVFARRSLKIKDTEADSIAQEIADTKDKKDDNTKSKILKNEFNASIKSRDSDKENDGKDQAENKLVDIAARVSQFGVHYQRSVSIHSVSNVKRESAPVYRNEINKYKKEVSDSTPEKRLRNRTFPDPSNDRDMVKSEVMAYKADTLTKRPWQRKDEFRLSVEKERRESSVIEGESGKDRVESEERVSTGEADASPQFKGILQMRAEWERRAKQGMTK